MSEFGLNQQSVSAIYIKWHYYEIKGKDLLSIFSHGCSPVTCCIQYMEKMLQVVSTVPENDEENIRAWCHIFRERVYSCRD